MKPEEQKLLNQLLSDERLTDPRWVAYIMATTKHETNHTFEPIEEAYWLSNAWRQANLRYYPAHGRGFVQITWPANYEKMSHRLYMPALASNYDLALEWNVAYEILVVGMIEGLFTGHDLDDFINEDHCDYNRARKIVNGMDQHKLIARYALDYENQIRALGTRFTGEPPDTQEPSSKSICTRTTLMATETGAKDPCIRVLQQALNKFLISAASMLDPIAEDGIFGRITSNRVTWFQRGFPGLTVDGIVGEKTWAALEPYL